MSHSRSITLASREQGLSWRQGSAHSRQRDWKRRVTGDQSSQFVEYLRQARHLTASCASWSRSPDNGRVRNEKRRDAQTSHEARSAVGGIRRSRLDFGTTDRHVGHRFVYATSRRGPVCIPDLGVAAGCCPGARGGQASGRALRNTGTHAQRQSALGDSAGDIVEHARTADLFAVAATAAAGRRVGAGSQGTAAAEVTTG